MFGLLILVLVITYKLEKSMKGFFIFMMLTLLSFLVLPMEVVSSVAQSDGVCISQFIDGGGDYLSVGTNVDVGLQQVDPPDIDAEQILDIPDKDAGFMYWVRWLSTICVFILYEVLVRSKLTNKSYSVITILYKIFGGIARDRKRGGGEH